MKETPHIFQSEQALHERAAAYIAKQAAEAIAAENVFHIALAGGHTPAGLYRSLAQPAISSRIAWARVHIWFGDERCVPPDHADSNYRMVRFNLLNRVPLPQTNVHRIQGELPPPEAAKDYAGQIRRTLPLANNLPRFDLVLLGVGRDGHVASLFPGTEILQSTDDAAAVHVAQLDAWRVSLTMPVINNARRVVVLAAGAAKADIVRRALGAPETPPLPVQMLKSQELQWYLDAEAASQLGREPTP